MELSKVTPQLDPAKRGKVIMYLLIALAVVAVVTMIRQTFFAEGKPENYGYFAPKASPIEIVHQDFTMGNYQLPKIAVLAPIPEAERLANPHMTAAQMQRAKWMFRTYTTIEKRNEKNNKINCGKDNEVWYVRLIKAVLVQEKDTGTGKGQAFSCAREAAEPLDQPAIQLLVGEDVIPSLMSGQLPTFSDAETAAWRAEAVKQKILVSELDMRRAKFFQTRYGVGKLPAPTPEDLEVRAQEKLEFDDKAAQNPFYARFNRIDRAPLSDNERMAKAVVVLNAMAGIAPVPAAESEPAPETVMPDRVGGL